MGVGVVEGKVETKDGKLIIEGIGIDFSDGSTTYFKIKKK